MREFISPTTGSPNIRYVTLDRVTLNDLMDNTPSSACYRLSSPASAGQIDAFISHAWSDSPHEKWKALQHWRMSFIRDHGREPRVWLDKMCCEQTRIAEELEYLPFYASRCKSLVALVSDIFLSRLYCVAETFFFISRPNAEVCFLPLGSACLSLGGLGQPFSFDIRLAKCKGMVERERLLAMVEKGAGSLDVFNTKLVKLLAESAHWLR